MGQDVVTQLPVGPAPWSNHECGGSGADGSGVDGSESGGAAFAGSGATFVWGSPKSDETNGPATSVVLWNPERVAVDDAGNVYIGDSPRVLKVDPQGASHLLATSS